MAWCSPSASFHVVALLNMVSNLLMSPRNCDTAWLADEGIKAVLDPESVDVELSFLSFPACRHLDSGGCKNETESTPTQN